MMSHVLEDAAMTKLDLEMGYSVRCSRATRLRLI